MLNLKLTSKKTWQNVKFKAKCCPGWLFVGRFPTKHNLIRALMNCYLSFLSAMLQFIKKVAAATNPSSNKSYWKLNLQGSTRLETSTVNAQHYSGQVFKCILIFRQAVQRNLSSPSWLNPSLPYWHRGLISKSHSHDFNYGKINCSKRSLSAQNRLDSHNYISDHVLIWPTVALHFAVNS